MQNNDDILDIIYKINDEVVFKKDGNKIVLVQKQNHKIQNFFRKLKFKIPEESYLTLDDYASYVFKQIDGKKNVRQIGEAVYDEFGDEANPLYERLLTFLNHLESTLFVIEKVKKLD